MLPLGFFPSISFCILILIANLRNHVLRNHEESCLKGYAFFVGLFLMNHSCSKSDVNFNYTHITKKGLDFLFFTTIKKKARLVCHLKHYGD